MARGLMFPLNCVGRLLERCCRILKAMSDLFLSHDLIFESEENV